MQFSNNFFLTGCFLSASWLKFKKRERITWDGILRRAICRTSKLGNVCRHLETFIPCIGCYKLKNASWQHSNTISWYKQFNWLTRDAWCENTIPNHHWSCQNCYKEKYHFSLCTIFQFSFDPIGPFHLFWWCL